MKWLWRSLYAALWLPFVYFAAFPWWDLWIATQDPARTCWLAEAYQTGHFWTPIEAAFFEGLFYGSGLVGIALLVVLIWHRNKHLVWKLLAILLPAGAFFLLTIVSGPVFNEAYFEIYRSHCPNAVQS